MRGFAVAIALALSCSLCAAQVAYVRCIQLTAPSPAASSPAEAASAAACPTVCYCPVKNAVSPEYPRHAERNYIRGLVVVRMTISATGALEDLKVIQSPHPSLSGAVERAVRQWEFPPSDGKYLAEYATHFR